DDITDEDMFVSLRDGDVGILVAEHPRRTQAGLRLPSISSVHKFLRWLIDARRSQPTIGPADAAAAVNMQLARRPRQRARPGAHRDQRAVARLERRRARSGAAAARGRWRGVHARAVRLSVDL